MLKIESRFDTRQRQHYAEIVGAHMMGILEDPLIAEMNQASIDNKLSFVDSVNRWGAAVRLLNWPRPEIPGLEDLTTAEVAGLQQKSDQIQPVDTLAKSLKADPLLKRALVGFPDFKYMVAVKSDDLLNNGVLDTARWFGVLEMLDMDVAELVDHPFFSVATSFTEAGHTAFSGVVSSLILQGFDIELPSTRWSALDLVSGAPKNIKLASLEQAGATSEAEFYQRGFCPAGRKRGENGEIWVKTLLNQAAKLRKAAPRLVSKPSFKLPPPATI